MQIRKSMEKVGLLIVMETLRLIWSEPRVEGTRKEQHPNTLTE